MIGATGYFDLQSGEFRQFDRVDVGEKVSGIAAASQQDAGFILDLDLSASGARLTDGETYTLQLYTSSETGVSLQTIRATFRIDSGAEPVANAVIENMIESLTPPPEVEESVPEEGAETQSLREGDQAGDRALSPQRQTRPKESRKRPRQRR